MIAAFVNDLKIMDDGDGNLYVRGYDRSFWDRYLIYFDKLYVVGRRFKISRAEIDGMDIFGNEKIELYEVPSIHTITTLLKNSKKIEIVLRELVCKVDCIITRQPGTNSNKVIEICRKYKKPYIVEVAGCPLDALWNHSLRGKLLAPYSYLKTRKNVKEAKYVIYVTDKFLQKRYPTDGKGIGCSDVALSSIQKYVLEKRMRHISQYKNRNQLHIATVGAVGIKYKGHQYMIRALAKSNKNIIYHIVGSGDSKNLKELSKKLLVSEQVIFHGSMKHNDIFDFLDDMDLYIQPSDTEGLPRALIEAMSSYRVLELRLVEYQNY